MDIEIKNEDAVITTCEQVVKAYIPELDSDIGTLNSTLSKIKVKWESNGMDKESYVLELEKQIKNLGILNGAIIQLFNSILVYAENIKKTSSNTLDVVLGNNFENYNVSVGYDSAYQAVNNTGAERIKTQYVNEASTFNAFAVVDSNGKVQEIERADGTSLNQFMQENGYELNDIAVDIAKNGQSQVWVSASDLIK